MLTYKTEDGDMEITSQWRKDPPTSFEQQNLEAGDYFLMIQDSAGCQYHADLMVDYVSRINFTAGEPVVNHCYGAPFKLSPIVVLNNPDRDSTIWTSKSYMLSNGDPWIVKNNLEPVVYPTQSGYFNLRIETYFTTEYGNLCYEEDSVEVSVRPDIGI